MIKKIDKPIIIIRAAGNKPKPHQMLLSAALGVNVEESDYDI